LRWRSWHSRQLTPGIDPDRSSINTSSTHLNHFYVPRLMERFGHPIRGWAWNPWQ
jgi:hypothetical protein